MKVARQTGVHLSQAEPRAKLRSLVSLLLTGMLQMSQAIPWPTVCNTRQDNRENVEGTRQGVVPSHVA